VVVAGAQYRCKSDLITVQTDTTSVECKKLEDIKYSIKADQLSFYIPALVHKQLILYSEFNQQEVILFFACTKLAYCLCIVKITACKISGYKYACNSNTSPSRDYWL